MRRSPDEKYFEDPDSLTEEEIIAALRKGTISMQIVPACCGSSFKNKGVQFLLDAVMRYLPSPLDKGSVKGTNPRNGEETCDGSVCGPAGFHPGLFRTAGCRFLVLNTRSGKKERVARLYQMHSNHQNPIEFVEAGDICAAVGFKDLRTGDTICLDDAPITLESMEFPDPVIGIAVEPKTQGDLDKLGIALAKLAEEDPTFTVKSDAETGQTVISGMGELHLDIIVDRLRREFGVEINQGAPQVNYKEAITASVQHREVFKKQTGGRGKFADIIVEIGPADEGVSGLQFDNEVKGGNIPKEFIPSIEKGFKSAMANGLLAGFEVQSLKVTVMDGSVSIRWIPISFPSRWPAVWPSATPARSASRCCWSPSCPRGGYPEDYMGDIVGDLNRRRGQINAMDTTANGARIIKAFVPLAEQFGYVTVLRTLSSGRATSTMTFDHYSELPATLAKDVIEKSGYSHKSFDDED